MLRRALEAIVIGLMLALATLVVVAVAYREAGAPLAWYDEVASVLLAWLTFYGAAYAALRQVHIGFPRFVQRARPHVRRALVATRSVVVIAFFGVTAWAGWRVVAVLGGTSLVSLPWISARLTQSVIPIGALLFIAAEIVVFPALWRGDVTGGEEDA